MLKSVFVIQSFLPEKFFSVKNIREFVLESSFVTLFLDFIGVLHNYYMVKKKIEKYFYYYYFYHLQYNYDYKLR